MIINVEIGSFSSQRMRTKIISLGEIKMDKEVEACEILDATKFYMNPETGSVDTGTGWIQDCIDPYNGFPVHELGTLYEVRKPRTAFERRAWGKWVPVD